MSTTIFPPHLQPLNDDKTPGFFQRINTVADFIADPCHAPIMVYIKTAEPFLAQAFMEFFSFSPLNMVFSSWAPRGARDCRGRRRRRRGRFRWRGLPDHENTVGKWLKSGESRQHIRQGTRVAMFYAFGRAVQMFAFWWLVIDITLDFLYRWTSAMVETEFCQATRFGRATRTSILWTSPLGGGTWTMGTTGDSSATSPGNLFPGAVGNAENPVKWVVDGNVGNNASVSQTVTLRAMVTQGGVAAVAAEEILTLAAGGSAGFTFDGKTDAPAQVSVELTFETGSVTFFQTTMSAIGYEKT